VPSPIADRIQANIARVERRIRAACVLAGRGRDRVTMIAVTKGRSVDEMLAALDGGLFHLGENRIEELETKLPAIRERWSGQTPVWHMIGHLQSRKAARAVLTADLIHSVDSVRLARRLDRAADASGVRARVLLQVNVSGERAKSGFAVATPEGEAAFLAEIGALAALEHLDVQGLMTIAPQTRDPGTVRPHFRRLRLLRDRLREAFPYSTWDTLSMGMTDDLEIAIEEGATMIRVGRALFDPPAPQE
jgi:PLP dependent protein